MGEVILVSSANYIKAYLDSEWFRYKILASHIRQFFLWVRIDFANQTYTSEQNCQLNWVIRDFITKRPQCWLLSN